jgi:hypothetical protein
MYKKCRIESVSPVGRSLGWRQKRWLAGAAASYSLFFISDTSFLMCRGAERKTLQRRDGNVGGAAERVARLKGLRPAFHKRRTSRGETPSLVCKAISKVERTRKAEMNVYVRTYQPLSAEMDVCTYIRSNG